MKFKKFNIDFNLNKPFKPNQLGIEIIEEISLETLAEYIDWSPFFNTWGLHGKYPDIFEYELTGKQAKELFEDAQVMLKKILKDKSLTAKAIFGLFPANSVGDDIEVYNSDKTEVIARFLTLRQQLKKKEGEPNIAISDFIAPKDSKIDDYIGCFCVSAGFGSDELSKQYEDKPHVIKFPGGKFMLWACKHAEIKKIHVLMSFVMSVKRKLKLSREKVDVEKC